MQELDQFNQECLYAHNGLRKAHGVLPLIYSREMAIEAQKYAQIIADNKLLHHSKSEDRKDCGENLAQIMKQFVNYVYSGLGAAVNWYAEIKDYNFDLENQTSKNPTGHFTQLIWKDSKNAGFGRVRNPINNTWYIVGRYYPAGNVKGYFKRNVFPLPTHLKWDDVSIVKEYLEELQLWEFTNARKHVLDSYSYSIASLSNKKGFLVKETFKPLDGDIYYESQIFETDVTKQPRPMFAESSISNHPMPEIISQDEQNNRRKDNVDADETINDKLLNLENFNNSSYDAHPSIALSVVSEDDQNFVNCLLARHNLYRENYGVQQLSLDNELSRYAQEWANHLCDECYLGLSHYRFKESEIGENIAMKNGELTKESAFQLVDNWCNENKFYFYDMKNDDIREFGHFTQIVWKNTRKIGIGICTNLAGFNFIVCFYYPPGNIKNEFNKMVPRLI